MIRISIVIPTRERADTLRYCLETCVAQNFEEVEFIVSSNACTDITKDVALSFNDSRIRLIETPRRLSMTENWEFALGHARGQYVGYLGDDDGILPMGLTAAWSALTEHDYPAAVSVPLAVFVWPNAVNSMARTGWGPGTLIGHLGDKARILDSREMLVRYANSEADFGCLPRLYYGLVKATSIEKAKRKGRFFHSKIPDVYAGVAIAAVSDHYLQLSEAVMMAGLSNHSNGAMQLYGQDAQKRGSQVAELFATENNLPFHPALIECPSLPILMGESFLQAKDLGLIPPPLDWNFQRMLEAAIRQLPAKSEAVQLEIIQALGEIAGQHHLDSSCIPKTPSPASPISRDCASVTSLGTTFRLDTTPFQIESTSDAVRVYGLLQRLARRLFETHASTEMKLRDAEATAEDARIQARATESTAEEARSLRAAAETARAALVAELASMRSSRSWRVTAPLRALDAFVRRKRDSAPTERGLAGDWVRRLRSLWKPLRRR